MEDGDLNLAQIRGFAGSAPSSAAPEHNPAARKELLNRLFSLMTADSARGWNAL
ncbi:hypothetical protein Mame01_29060 [Microbispora amethystogenes]|nr:hypothetical protein Mame01_29060 [Microbispora amethystogenes]